MERAPGRDPRGGDDGKMEGAFTIFGDGAEYGSEEVLGAGDVDLDGVLDVAVWQHPGSLDPVVSLVSSATLMSGAHVSVLTDALRRIEGLGTLEQPDDLAPVGDLNADGETDLATVIVDSQSRYDSERQIAVTVFTGSSLVEPSTTMNIEMAEPGRIRPRRSGRGVGRSRRRWSRRARGPAVDVLVERRTTPRDGGNPRGRAGGGRHRFVVRLCARRRDGLAPVAGCVISTATAFPRL